MRKTFIPLVMPNSTMAMGSRAVTGTDMPSRISGLKNAPAGRHTPIRMPAPTPSTVAAP